MIAQPTVLLPTFGSAGDVNPFIIIGRELQRRGRRVIVISNPHFGPQVEAAGLDFLGIGSEEEYRRVINDPDLWHPTRSFYVMAENAILSMLRPLYELIVQFDPATTTIGAPGIMFGARLAHETHGFPYATLQLQPGLFRSAYAMPVQGVVSLPGWLPPSIKRGWINFLDRAVIDRTLAPRVNAFRAELGLPPARHFFGDFLHGPQLSIGLFPDWFAPPQPDWPSQVRLTGFIHAATVGASLTPELEAFLAAGAPPVVFTPGSAMKLGDNFFDVAVQACARVGCRGLLITPFPEQVPPHLPDGVHHCSFAPFDLLLPRAAALVYHGGIGTLAQALAAGIPHLVMPMGHDQPDNAHRLETLGVGATVRPKQFTPQRVAAALNALLNDPARAARARQLAPRVDFTDSLAATCDLLLALSPAE